MSVGLELPMFAENARILRTEMAYVIDYAVVISILRDAQVGGRVLQFVGCSYPSIHAGIASCAPFGEL